MSPVPEKPAAPNSPRFPPHRRRRLCSGEGPKNGGGAGLIARATAKKTAAAANGDEVSATESKARVLEDLGLSFVVHHAKDAAIDFRDDAVGPTRLASNVRCDVITDYARCICKDYKETGYCGYGDSCIFLHDRTDYPGGWQIDRDWEATRQDLKAKISASAKGGGDQEAADSTAAEPCGICGRSDPKDPVITQCNHAFCEACALQRFRAGDKKCARCERPTMGIFNRMSARHPGRQPAATGNKNLIMLKHPGLGEAPLAPGMRAAVHMPYGRHDPKKTTRLRGPIDDESKD